MLGEPWSQNTATAEPGALRLLAIPELRWMPLADPVLSVMEREITESVSVAVILKVKIHLHCILEAGPARDRGAG
jgi:hypothetical protein